MVAANDLQPQFNAGELSPLMVGRVDFSKYAAGLATCFNLIPLPQGGVTRRPGTRYVNETKDSSARPRGIGFQFNTEQAYVIEAGNTYFRFFRNQARIEVADTDASITNGTFDSDVSGWDDRSTGGAGNQISHDSTNDRMTLTPSGTAADDIGWAEQDVTTTNTNQEHVLQFRVYGAPGDKIEFRVGTTSTGNEIIDDLEVGVGFHAIAFTPTASPFYVQFRNKGSVHEKSIGIDDVALIDNAPVEIVTPYATADLSTIQVAQTNDVLYVVHPDYPVYKLIRRSNSSWSLEEALFEDGPYLDENTTSTTMTPGAATGLNQTFTASSTNGINGGDGFQSTDVGRLVRFQHSSSTEPGYGIIVSVTSTTVARIDIKRTFGTASSQVTWSLGAWSGTTGYPTAVGFFEQRSAFAGTSNQPQTFWLSQSADIENFRADSWDSSASDKVVEDDDALAFTFAAREVNVIRWMSGGQQLVIGTAGGEWVCESDGAIITPTDIQVRQHTTHGSAAVPPLRVDHVVLFLQRAKRKLREFAFSFDSNSFQAPDINILSEHVTSSGIDEMDYQEEPHSLLWLVRSDGLLTSSTYRRNQDVVGWARHQIGGTFQGGAAVVESVVCIPGTNGSGQVEDSTERDEVWLFVKRTINGATKRYVEVLEKEFDGPERHSYSSDAAWKSAMRLAQRQMYYADSLLTRDSPVTVSGATAANPVVITTSSAHGFSNDDLVVFDGVKGMTDLNGNTYRVAEVTSTTFELAAVEGKSISAATKANPGQITITGHGFSTGDEIHFHDVNGMTELNGNGYTVTVVDSNNITIGVDTSGFTTYTSGGKAYLATDGSGFTAYIADGSVRDKVTSVSGLDHLEGETVKVLGDGAIQSDQTVSSGAITLDTAAAVIQVGLGYTHKMESLKITAGAVAGTTIGQTKKINKLAIVLLDAATFTYRQGLFGTANTKEFREVGDPMDEAVPLFTGETIVDLTTEFAADPRFVVESDNPSAFTCLAIGPQVETNDT